VKHDCQAVRTDVNSMSGTRSQVLHAARVRFGITQKDAELKACIEGRT
jgi:hypothetical protein